jgi:hypothetical protein
MKKHYILFTLASIFFYETSFAQKTQDTINFAVKSKNLYFKSVIDYINIKLDLDSNNERFELEGDNFDYDIRPNVSTVSKLSLNYLFLSFSYGFSPKIFPGNNDDDSKGKTKVSSYGLNLNFNHWIQELRYARVRGFYLENSEEYENPWVPGSTPFIQFPELRVTSFRGATSYKFNSNYSLNAISSQTEIQLKKNLFFSIKRIEHEKEYSQL